MGFFRVNNSRQLLLHITSIKMWQRYRLHGGTFIRSLKQVQDNVQRWTFVNTAMNPRVTYKAVDSLTSRVTNKFPEEDSEVR
jgi:hypothetical protein